MTWTQRRVHVVIVDPDRATFDAASAILSSRGYRVSWAATSEALELLADRDPGDAYLIEELPDWAADDVAQHVEYLTRPAPAILYLGKKGPWSVGKPLEAAALLRALEERLRLRREP